MGESEKPKPEVEIATAEAANDPGAPRDAAVSTDEFSAQAELPQPGLLGEFWLFLRYNKKWWLTPIILVLLGIGLLVLLSGTALAPLLYPFF